MSATAEKADARTAIDAEKERIAMEDSGRRTIEQLAEDGGEPQDELFPVGTLPGDPRVTWKSLIKAGTTVKLACNLSRAEVPLTDGLYGFGEKGEVLVTFEAGAVKSVPEFGDENSSGERKVKGVKLVQELRSIHTRDGAGLYTREQVVDLLDAAGVPAAKVSELLAD